MPSTFKLYCGKSETYYGNGGSCPSFYVSVAGEDVIICVESVWGLVKSSEFFPCGKHPYIQFL